MPVPRWWWLLGGLAKSCNNENYYDESKIHCEESPKLASFGIQ